MYKFGQHTVWGKDGGLSQEVPRWGEPTKYVVSYEFVGFYRLK